MKKENEGVSREKREREVPDHGDAVRFMIGGGDAVKVVRIYLAMARERIADLGLDRPA
jgi:hypothetical protein